MFTRANLFKIGAATAAISFFITLSWAVVDTGINATGDYEFCTGCHSHKAAGTSYREDLHGGNNRVGWRATCSDCHISHDNSFSYLWVKGVHGIVDPAIGLVEDPYDIDWHAKRENRGTYVYDSGCLNCHKYLEQSSNENRSSFLPHRKYFAEQEELTCVSCHAHVGHSNLGAHLQEQGWLKKDRL